MKRKDICEATGLTPKALRLYEEKGLIVPSKDGLHYKTRDYSQVDLDRLTIIATLRKAMFTIEEIRQMLEEPSAIQTIFPQYLDWLRQQSRQIQDLLAVSEQVDLSSIHDVGDLTEQIAGATKKLPIPASDIHFRFRQIDELEERPASTAAKPIFDGKQGTGRLQIITQRSGNVPYGPIDMIEQYRYKAEKENGTAPLKSERDSRGMRIAKGIFMGLALFSGFMILLNWFGSPKMQIDNGKYWPWLWTVLCIAAAAVRAVLEFISWRRQQFRYDRE